MSLGEYMGASLGITKGLWHLNGNSTDSSGNSNNGTDTNISYSLANGKFRQGALFNGTNSKIVVSYDTSLNFGTSPFTVSLWMKTTSVATGILLAKYSQSATLDYYALIFFGSYVGFRLRDRTFGSDWNTNSISSVNDGLWHNVIGVREGATSRKIYIDGNLETTETDDISATNLTSNQTTTFGCFLNSTPVAFYAGAIDETILENYAWTASQIKKYYTNSLGRFL